MFQTTLIQLFLTSINCLVFVLQQIKEEFEARNLTQIVIIEVSTLLFSDIRIKYY